MAPNPKIFQVGAYKPEVGATGLTQSSGWGDTGAHQTPGAGDALPWLDFNNEPNIKKVADNSITNSAASAAKRTIGREIDSSISFYFRFNYLDYFYYWTMGFANNSQTVVVFTAGDTPWVSSEPAAGTIFEDSVPTEFTYLRTFLGKDADGDAVYYYVFSADTTPALAAGTLTEKSPGSTTFTYTAHSVLKYERLYELDQYGRHYRAFTTAESGALDDYTSGDVKNAMCTFAKRFSAYDVRYGNSLCKSFTYSIPAEDVGKLEAQFLAWDEDESSAAGGYGSDDWTFVDPALDNNQNAPAHYQTVFQIGESVSAWTEYCMSDLSVAVTIPLQQIQTTCSGQHLAEPVIEGHYQIQFTGMIARHETKTMKEYRDGDTLLFARIGMNQGFDSIEFLMKNLTLDKAGPDNGDVAAEPLEGECSKCSVADDDFINSDWLYGHTQLENMPLLIRTINDTETNPMFDY